MGAGAQGSRLRLFQSFSARESRDQLRALPREHQQDGRGAPRQDVEHGVLFGVPSRARAEFAAEGQDHGFGLEPASAPSEGLVHEEGG